jgi:hypothetical protein
MPYASKGVHTLFTGQRERERERGTRGGRERCRICPELLFLFLKGMTGALAPFSYLVLKIYFGYSVRWKFTKLLTDILRSSLG